MSHSTQQRKMVRIEITKQTTANGEAARVGDVIDVPDTDARYLIGSNRAKDAKGEKLYQGGKPKPAKAGKDEKKETAPAA